MTRSVSMPRLMAVALSLVALPALAAETIAPVVVTATRTAQTTNEVLASVTVITRAEIEDSGVQSLADLLARQRGVSLSHNGPYGKATSLYMRGTSEEQVLVLINGVKVGSATLGSVAFQHLPLSQIERIEIVRGPHSSIYGSEAVGGVIQIFTRTGESGPLRTRVSIMRGGHDTQEATAAISGGDANTRFAITAKVFETAGINVRGSAFPDKDGYHNRSASLSFSQDFGPGTTWTVRAVRAEGVTEFDACAFPNPSQYCETEFVEQVISTRVETRVTDRWSTWVSVGQSQSDSETDVNNPGEFDTTRQEFSWQNDISLGLHQLITLGYDYRETTISSDASFAEDERSSHAVFAQWQWTGRHGDLRVSVRRDDYDAFDDPVTGSIGAGWRFSPSLRVYASAGTAFNAPSFNQLYYPNFGNPDLQPEESQSFEIGLVGGDDVHWSVAAFHTEIDQAIALFCTPAFVCEPRNLNAAEINGLELAWNTTHGGWRLSASATLLDTRIATDGANDGNELPRRPERKFNFDFSRDFGQFYFGAHIRHEGERFDGAANTTRLDDYTLISFRFGYEATRNLTIEGSIENAGDVEHETVATFGGGTYNSLGRTVYARLRYRF